MCRQCCATPLWDIRGRGKKKHVAAGVVALYVEAARKSLMTAVCTSEPPEPDLFLNHEEGANTPA